MIDRDIDLATNYILLMTGKHVANPRRVALTLDLGQNFKRHTELFVGTQQYGDEHGWHSIVDNFARDSLPARPSRDLPYDGIIARANRPLAERAAKLGIPLVNVWYSSPVRDRLPGVFPDHAVVGRIKAEHLLSRGLQNFAVMAFREDRTYADQLQSIRQVVGDAGYECDVTWVPLDFDVVPKEWRATEKTITTWMDRWKLPIGVLVTTEILGRMIVQLCQQRGWRVPEDVAILAGQNEENLCEHPHPSLSSIELDFGNIGYEAARLLDQLMDRRSKRRKPKQQSEHILLPPRGVIVRESSDFLAVDDEAVALALEFIGANSYRVLTPADVARAASMHLRALQRRFDECLGRGIAAEIRRLRIERAKRELTQSELPMQTIARNIGFSSGQHLNDVFVRELGITPGEYRKQHQRMLEK